ncbi:hypothetical protein B0T21DRAFT_433799 [Apiosordaria backusii]|uniref:Uncharacterized protein n=1 Tax=Apiosordaria backusii TaxID=314023 RepID=A0AA40EMK4_9PEZI|nr:hypothetical protein B0T21DRAFT_433799 [Apiosordaria backusii]
MSVDGLRARAVKYLRDESVKRGISQVCLPWSPLTRDKGHAVRSQETSTPPQIIAMATLIHTVMFTGCSPRDYNEHHATPGLSEAQDTEAKQQIGGDSEEPALMGNSLLIETLRFVCILSARNGEARETASVDIRAQRPSWNTALVNCEQDQPMVSHNIWFLGGGYPWLDSGSGANRNDALLHVAWSHLYNCCCRCQFLIGRGTSVEFIKGLACKTSTWSVPFDGTGEAIAIQRLWISGNWIQGRKISEQKDLDLKFCSRPTGANLWGLSNGTAASTIRVPAAAGFAGSYSHIGSARREEPSLLGCFVSMGLWERRTGRRDKSPAEASEVDLAFVKLLDRPVMQRQARPGLKLPDIAPGICSRGSIVPRIIQIAGPSYTGAVSRGAGTSLKHPPSRRSPTSFRALQGT